MSQDIYKCDIGETTILSRLIDAPFPDYQQIIPPDDCKTYRAILHSKLYQAAVKRVMLLSSDTNMIEYHFDEGRVILTSADQQVGQSQDEIPCQYEGQPVTIGFNGKYVLELRGALPENDVHLSISDPLNPGLFTMPDLGMDVQAVIMPIRI